MNYYNSDSNPSLHIVVYSLNQKGRSEPVIFENVPIIEADKRAGEYWRKIHRTLFIRCFIGS